MARARAGRPNASYATAVPVHARPSSGPRGSASEPGGPRCEEQWPSPSGDVPLEPVRAQYSGGADSSSIELSALTDWMGRANRPDILAGRRPPRGPFGVHWAFKVSNFRRSLMPTSAPRAGDRRVFRRPGAGVQVGAADLAGPIARCLGVAHGGEANAVLGPGTAARRAILAAVDAGGAAGVDHPSPRSWTRRVGPAPQPAPTSFGILPKALAGAIGLDRVEMQLKR